MKERKEKEGAEREKGREEKFNALIKWRHQNPSSSRDTQSGHCVSFFFFFFTIKRFDTTSEGWGEGNFKINCLEITVNREYT